VTGRISLVLVFGNVLLEQLGLPVPAVPTLVVAGALAADHHLPAVALVAVVLSACVLSDCAWYAAGRLYGARVMSLLCRISLTPDTCVGETQSTFERWGAKALLIAKFVPGLGLMAPPLAGAVRMSFVRFLVFSLLGATLWSGAALLAGVLLKSQIEALLPQLAGIGGAALLGLLLLLAAYIVFKGWERRRFRRALDMARISVTELHERLADEPAPLVVDVRSSTAQSLELRRIPGALHLPVQDVTRHLGGYARDREIILYCTCPNEASAAQAARLLMNHGFSRVRPLHGGLHAWVEAGYAVEELAVVAQAAPEAPEAAATPLAPKA
jgi:membrane protein DedA with SNARE-associated domain/rhodanese-related sulfurtransferase